jgi:HEAT repeat protein
MEIVLAALQTLGVLGAEAGSSVAAITQLLEHKESSVRSAAIDSLAKIERNAEIAVPRLVTLLGDSDWTVRRSAALGLATFKGEAARAVVPLIGLLSSDIDREAAREALTQIDSAEPDAIPVLVKALEGTEPRSQFFAVSFLGKLGPQAKDALPALRKLASEDNNRFRRSVEEAIKKIEGDAPAAP